MKPMEAHQKSAAEELRQAYLTRMLVGLLDVFCQGSLRSMLTR